MIADLLGRFHPVLVHLPIGILLLGAVFLVLARRPRHAALGAALPLIMLLGALSAAAACVTGWLLAAGGEYDNLILNRHRWLGVALAVLALAGYALVRDGRNANRRLPLAIALTLLLTATGHLGGALTHGEGYLIRPLRAGADAVSGLLTVTGNIEDAALYADLVRPLLERKCQGCHGPSRQKGGLRLDTPEGLRRGGKNGAVLTAGDAAGSELYRRLELDPLDEQHMPPKGKPQLSEAERTLLRWWIESGAGYEGAVRDLGPPEAIRAVLKTFEARPDSPRMDDVPADPVTAASPADIETLRSLGVVVTRVAQNSNYLSANFLNAPAAGDEALQPLLPLARQVVWLRLGDTRITDAGMATVGRLSRLTRLSLERTAITDAGLRLLGDLQHLQYLNLVGTGVTAGGVATLRGLPRLRTVYLYETGVTSADWPALRNALPDVVLDSGGYSLERPPEE